LRIEKNFCFAEIGNRGGFLIWKNTVVRSSSVHQFLSQQMKSANLLAKCEFDEAKTGRLTAVAFTDKSFEMGTKRRVLSWSSAHW
jgi:hypothetical protein